VERESVLRRYAPERGRFIDGVVRARLLTVAGVVERVPRPARTLSRRIGPHPARAVGLLTHFTVTKLPSQGFHRQATNGSMWLQGQGTVF
jgi:hypothetical protein